VHDHDTTAALNAVADVFTNFAVDKRTSLHLLSRSLFYRVLLSLLLDLQPSSSSPTSCISVALLHSTAYRHGFFFVGAVWYACCGQGTGKCCFPSSLPCCLSFSSFGIIVPFLSDLQSVGMCVFL